MSTDVAEAEALEAGTTIADDQVPSEEVQAKKDAELLAEVEKIQQPAETQEPQTGEGGESEPPAEEEGKEAPAGEGGEKPPELDRATLAHALEAGFDEDSAKRFHQAGLLGDALVTFDRRLIRDIGAAESTGRQAQQPGPSPAPVRQPQPSQQIEADRSGKGTADSPPGALSAEEYGEDIVKRDAWHQQRIDELTTQVKDLTQVSGAFLNQRAQNFENWFEERIQGLANPDLFGKGGLGSLGPESSERKNRFAVADAYNGLCQAQGVDPHELVPELAERAYHATFHSEISKAAQQKTLDRLRNAKGQFVTPSRPSGSGPPTKDQRTEEEREADLMKEVQGILDRPPK